MDTPPEALTIALWKWRKFNNWSTNYSAQHVNAAARMIKKHLHMPHRVLCITDDPTGIECETYPLWNEPVVETKSGSPNCYKRLKLFSKDMENVLGKRFVSMDLDVLLMPGPDGRGITPLFENDDDFKIISGWRGEGATGKGCCPYNGSLWMGKTGTRPQVWDEFDPLLSPNLTTGLRMPNGLKWYGSDQCWMAYKIPNEKTWGPQDGVYSFIRDGRGRNHFHECRIMIFPGNIKPWSNPLARQNPYLWKEYRKYL